MEWRCICFDLDNTLLNYEVAFEEGMKAAFDYFTKYKWKNDKKVEVAEWFPIFKKLCNELWLDVKAHKYTKNEYRQKRFIESLKHFGMKADEKMAIEFQLYFYSIVHHFVQPMAGVEALLDDLKSKDINIGIITNGNKSIQYNKIKNLQLDQWFSEEHIIISEEYKVAKPNPLIFQIANQKVNPTSFSPLFVGDSWELDVVGSVNAGWDAIFFNSRNEKPSTSHHPIGTCHTIKEVKELIR